MTVLYGRIVSSTNLNLNNYSSNHNHNHNNSQNKGDIINVTKAVVRKSILMQITRAKVGNGFH
jgi:hypothetical protein